MEGCAKGIPPALLIIRVGNTGYATGGSDVRSGLIVVFAVRGFSGATSCGFTSKVFGEVAHVVSQQAGVAGFNESAIPFRVGFHCFDYSREDF